MLKLNAIATGITENGRKISPGDVVEYLGHLGGQCVGIRFADGTKDHAHPACFKELS